jgi:hypothetical protein
MSDIAPWLNDLVQEVTKVAPVLGTALGGPMGGVVGALISNQFGGAGVPAILQRLTSDPAAAEKLKELEYTHQEALAKMAVDDRISARAMENSESTRRLVVVFVVFLLVLNVLAIQIVTDSQLDHFLIGSAGVLFGVLISLIRKAINLYFGG